MQNEYGAATIICKRCGSIYVLEDSGLLERMTGFVCPGCGEIMKARELAWLKGMYYLRLSRGLLNKPLGKADRRFDYRIDLGTHFKKE